MAKIRKYYYETTFHVLTCWICQDTHALAEFVYYFPDKTLQVPRYEFHNFGLLTLGEYNYEVFLFIRRVSKMLADGSMKEYRANSGQQVEFDFPSEDALF